MSESKKGAVMIEPEVTKREIWRQHAAGLEDAGRDHEPRNAGL